MYVTPYDRKISAVSVRLQFFDIGLHVIAKIAAIFFPCHADDPLAAHDAVHDRLAMRGMTPIS